MTRRDHPLKAIYDVKSKKGAPPTGAQIGATVVFDTEGCETFGSGSSVTWDAHYSASFWGLTSDLGGGRFSISGGIAQFNGVNPAKEIKLNAVPSRNAWVSAENRTDYTTGADRQVRLIVNAGRDGTGTVLGASSYYYAFMGRVGGVSTVQIGKWWNSVDVILATAPRSLVAGDVVRIRHDGAGNLYLDVNGVEVLTAFDSARSLSSVAFGVSGTGVFLRALGVGLGGSTTDTTGGNNVAVDNFCWGTWSTVGAAAPTVPNPWWTADHVDIDTIGNLWTKDPSGGGLLHTLEAGSPGHWSIYSPNNTDYAQLTDASLLAADQFVELSVDALQTVKQIEVLLRSASSSLGYSCFFFTTGNTPFNDAFWRIQIKGGSVLATTATLGFGFSYGRIRVRFQVVGSTIGIYVNNALVLSATDSSITAANTVRLGPKGNGGQGILQMYDMIVGNL